MTDVTKCEDELGNAASLVGEIVDWRRDGVVDTEHGSEDDDLLGAVESLEDAIKAWRAERRSS